MSFIRFFIHHFNTIPKNINPIKLALITLCWLPLIEWPLHILMRIVSVTSSQLIIYKIRNTESNRPWPKRSEERRVGKECTKRRRTANDSHEQRTRGPNRHD